MAINWRERVVAAAIHFVVTLLLAGVAAAIIFLVWFPGEMASIIGGTKLFLLVVVSDLVLGPLMSLVIYSSKKSRRELFIDYSVIATVQMAALVYGVLIVAGSRPVFIAFETDRLEIVTAIELEDADLAAGIDPQFQSKSWLGPRWVAVAQPADRKEATDRLFSSLGGKGSYLTPKYYRPYDTARDRILNRSKSIQELLHNSKDESKQIEAAIADAGKPAEELRWLLLHHRFGFSVAFIDAHTAAPLKYLALDPIWVDDGAKSEPAQPAG